MLLDKQYAFRVFWEFPGNQVFSTPDEWLMHDQ